MGSARKPVIVRKFSREWYAGYAGAVFGQDSSALEVLDLTGKVLTIGWDSVKWVCYVRGFSTCSDPANPERLQQKRFAVRPRTAGLWLRMTLNDGDELEGIASNDRAALKLTAPGTAFGTPEYIAPEQAMGQKVDARADVYGVGVVLFEMATGRMPFQSDEDLG